MNTAPDDAALVARCKRELPYQHAAYEQLVARYQHRVYTLCYRLVGNAPTAEDLTQEVFTRVFLNLKNFAERAAFSSWLYRIAHNHCLNFLARRKREQTGMADYAETQQRQAEQRSQDRDSAQMQDALNQMNEEPRSLLIMKYVLELELVEISDILGISVGAVKMRLLRARDEFRKAYAPNQTTEGN